MKKFILPLLLCSTSLFAQDYFSNDLASFYLKVEGENLSWVNDSGREVLKLELPAKKFQHILLSDDGAKALLQDPFGNLFLADKDLKKIVDLKTKVKDGFTHLTQVDSNTFMVGSNSGAVRKISIENKYFQKVAHVEEVIKPVGIPVKEIRYAKSKDMFYVLHQKIPTEPIGFNYQNTLPKDIQTKPHQAIGFTERDLSPSGFHKPIGFSDAPDMTNIALYKAQEENFYLRLKQNTQQLSVFEIGKEGKLVKKFVSNDFTKMWMADDFTELVLSSDIKNEIASFRFRDILKNGESKNNFLIQSGHVDFIEQYGKSLVMGNADERAIKFFDLSSGKITSFEREANIRGILNTEGAKYIIYENGQIDLLISNGKYVNFEQQVKAGEKYARNLKPKRIGNKVIVLDDRGLEKEIFLPKSCGSLY